MRAPSKFRKGRGEPVMYSQQTQIMHAAGGTSIFGGVGGLTHVEDAGHQGLRDQTPTAEVHHSRRQGLDAQLGVESLAQEVESHNAGKVLER